MKNNKAEVKVFIVRSADPLDMEGSPDVESVWSTYAKASEVAEELTAAEKEKYPTSKHLVEYYVEEWIVDEK